MKDLDLPYLCRSIGGLCGFPVRLYEGGELVCKTDHSGLAYDPAEACREDLFRLEGPAAAYVTPRYSFYGLVRRGETRLILGPTRQVPASEPHQVDGVLISGVAATASGDRRCGVSGGGEQGNASRAYVRIRVIEHYILLLLGF